MSNFENPENTTNPTGNMSSNNEDFMTIGEAISYMCEKLGRISRTTFYRCGYRKMITVRSYGRNKSTGREAVKLCRKSEVDYIIQTIQENPHAENL
ncbi:hypothetical protein NC796_10145 [Aliifodinibius sp. S!AR15-10]|uniref:hypothetical protein n=1 Tax=Aliifodinibius sp. S!AR15-10 TaxID=2950437 RepID=UPI002865098C|nr:hypothetical protein [Aliifodinibius sp. S!AR15-10]MDR8391501.1 hypothetical protein [Aliifodinibius sp. S!AR15-10]